MYFNNKLERKGCESNAHLAMMALTLLGDQVNKYEDHDKTSLMWIDSNQKGISCISNNKNQLRIHYQQLFGKELSKDSIESIMSCYFQAIEGHLDLEHQVHNYSVFVCELLGYDVFCALKFEGEVHREMK